MSGWKHIEKLPNFRAATLPTYIAGFVLALTLTVCSFALVAAYRDTSGALFDTTTMIALLAVLGAVQMVVQILFFLHLSAERRLRLNLIATIFTVFAIGCIVGGSIWIMHNLDYNMMPQRQTEYIEEKEGIYRD